MNRTRPVSGAPAGLVALLLAVGALAISPSRSHAQTDSTRGHRRIQPLPAVGSAPETGLQYGATVFAVFAKPLAVQSRPSTAVAYAIRTAKSQTRIGVEGEHWTTGNARRFAGSLVWQKYPLPFYGIGDAAPESAKEIFTPSGIEANASAQQRIAGSLYALSSARVVDQTIRTDSTGALRSSGLAGVTGGRVVELAVGMQDDSRDNVFAPMHGRLVQLAYSRSDPAVGSDFTYGRLRFDGRMYGTIRGRHVIALHAQAVRVDGEAPFDGLALV